jgi:hypothetical protein
MREFFSPWQSAPMLAWIVGVERLNLLLLDKQHGLTVHQKLERFKLSVRYKKK